MGYRDFLKETSERKGVTQQDRLKADMQSGWNAYFASTPDRVTVDVDGVNEDVVIQHIRYGEDKYDNKILLAENTTNIVYGSKITWKGRVWLVINYEDRAIDTHKPWKILLTQNTMVSKSEQNEVLTEPCHITTATSRADGNKNVQLKENSWRIRVQSNQTTLSYYINQRFLFNNKVAYKIVNLNYSEFENQIDITLEPTQELPEDDFVNNIAYNKTPVSTIPETGKTGIFFTKDSLSISEGDTDSVNVYEYITDVIQPSTIFTFRIDDIDASNYDIVASDDNSITIKSLGYYYSGTLVAIDTSDLSEHTIPLELTSPLG